MLNLKFKERRNQSRKKLSGLLPGKLVRLKDDSQIVGRPIDVSDKGLGLLVSEKLAVGETLLLTTKTHSIELEIIWSQPDFGKRDLIRYGLITKNSDESVEKLFEDYGCFTRE